MMELVLLIARLAFLASINIFVYQVVTVLRRESQRIPASPAKAGVLQVVQGVGLGPGQRLSLEQVTTLGRAADNALVLPDPLISRHHARLTYRGGSWMVEDLGGRNGTWVNEQAVDGGSISLPAGSRLQLGETVLRLVA